MKEHQLPKLYAPVKLAFWSLRNGVSKSGGVIFDIDTMVEHKCRRVLCNGKWKWQIIDLPQRIEWDYFVETDQECLNNMDDPIADVDLIN